MKSTIQLDRYFFQKINIEWHQGEQNRDTPPQLLVDYNVLRNKEKNNLFRLDFFLQLLPAENSGGIKIDTVLQGFFSFPEGTEEEEMQKLIRINGCTILYSTLRGHISMFTANYPCGTVTLPSVVMADVVQDIEAKKQKLIDEAAKKK